MPGLSLREDFRGFRYFLARTIEIKAPNGKRLFPPLDDLSAAGVLRRFLSIRLATRACQSLTMFCVSGGSIASNFALSRLALCVSCRFAHSEKRELTTARPPPMAKPRLPMFEGYLSTFEGYSNGMRSVSTA